MANRWGNNSLGQNTGVGSLSLLQEIFATQESNPGLLHCKWILYQLSHKGIPRILDWVAHPFSSRSSQLRNWTGVSCIAGNPALQEDSLLTELSGKPWNNGQWQFIFLDSKITADGDCSHEIKRRLLLGRKAMTNLDCMLKNRDITLPTKVRLVKAMVFLVVTYGCESWTIKKAEHQRTDGFELWCWRRLLRVPWTARRSNQSILKEISSEC